MTQKKIIIHGVHRSGTSLTANLVEEMGAWFAHREQQMPSQNDNTKGFWERLDVVKINDAILHDHGLSWNSLKPGLSDQQIEESKTKYSKQIGLIVEDLNEHGAWFLKDPRFSFTWPIWDNIIGGEKRHIVVWRHPLAVARSLEKRNQLSLELGLIFWAHQSIEILKSIADEKYACHMFFDGTEEGVKQNIELLNHLLCDSDAALKPLKLKQVSAVFDKGLVHQVGQDQQLKQLFPEILDLWKNIQNQNLSKIDFSAVFNPNQIDWNQLDSSFSAKTLGSELLEISEKSEAKLQSKLLRLQNEFEQTQDSLRQTQGDLEQSKRTAFAVYVDIANSLSEFKRSKIHRLSNFLVSPVRLLKGVKPSALDHIEAALSNEIGQNGVEQQVKDRRKLLIKAILNNPLLFIKKISPSRVIKAINVILGSESSQINLDQVLTNYSTLSSAELLQLKIFDKKIDLDEIQFPKFSKPDVSIVVPVYNNYQTTLSCLKSIEQSTSSSLRYEVIIADDCSTDQTQSLSDNSSITVVKTEKNLGFLGNCNNACSHAKGKYIVLLNNDTNVQENWLEALLSKIKSDASIGVVGPMLLYPDGRLQEAGGIIFSDGSGWNYGRLDSPNKPEYQFSRKVDYISGACLLFRKSDWDSLGGFDSYFAPAYYEDTDLCFAMREKGLSVDYVPAAKVVHFEGVSHGTDEKTGVKKYQAVNREKFLKKWTNQLLKNHYKDSSSLFLARRHGKNQKTVLIIDHYVPMYDKDAGSRSTYMYLKLFLEENIRVIFMGDNFYPHQPYTEHLQELGVEVLYGEYCKKNWLSWLKTNQAFFDAIYLHRPHIASQYIDHLKALENCPRLVYFGHDLHFLRLQREAELGMKNTSGQSIDKWKQTELSIMDKVDVSLFPSDHEVETIRLLKRDINVDSIPLNWFPEQFSRRTPNITSAPSLLFVGGFGHPPNVDGLNWFLDEIFPSVVKKVPEVVLTIIGSRCPEDIFQLKSPNISVLGEVSDQELNNAYEQARIAIVPLRYGAGVKGKVLEAMAKGVPVLTTPIGAEGLPSSAAKYLCIAENVEDFRVNSIELLNSDKMCDSLVSRAYTALDKNFSKEAAKKLIDYLF